MKFFNKQSPGLKAVYEDDLAGYLKSIGIYDAVMQGEYRCKYCGNVITMENLEVIIPDASGTQIVCNNKNCINQL
jgi:hypothetical protein